MNAGTQVPMITEINLIKTREFDKNEKGDTTSINKFHLMAQNFGQVVFSAEGFTISDALAKFAAHSRLWEMQNFSANIGGGAALSNKPMGGSPAPMTTAS